MTQEEQLYQKDLIIQKLEQQLAEKGKEIERLNDRLDKYISGRLKSMLAEKDKEINKLSKEHLEMFGDMKTYKNLWLAEQRKNKEIRKQVCDEFKKAIITESVFDIEEEASYWTDDEDITITISDKIIDVKTILEIIDRIEQGEQQ